MARVPVHDGPGVAEMLSSAEGLASTRLVLGLVSDKWTLPLVAALVKGPTRFGELQRGVPAISKRVLSYTLREMVRNGLVDRTVRPSIPPQVEYALTDLGRTLLSLLYTIREWAEAHADEILAARSRYLAPEASPLAGPLQVDPLAAVLPDAHPLPPPTDPL